MKYTLLIYHQLKYGCLYKSRIFSVNAPEQQVSAMISVKLFLLPIFMVIWSMDIRPQSEVCHYTVRKIIYKCKTFRTTVGRNRAEEEEQERIFHLQVKMFGHNAQHYVC